MSGLKLNPAIAKLASNGQVQCLICNTQVKPTAWLAHQNGRKHKEAVEAKKRQLTAPKRTAQVNGAGAPEAKRVKEDGVAPTTSDNNGGDLPMDFFDDAGESPLDIQTPWQKAKNEDKEKMVRIQSANVIEGVPQGFFDDKKKDGLVRDTIEKKAQHDVEYEKLMKEINEQEIEDARLREEEVDREARERDLANIDEQMEELRRLNELEIRKEQLLKQKKQRQRKEDSDDEDLGDVDFSDWRSHKIL